VLVLTTFDLDEYAFAALRRRKQIPAEERRACRPARHDPHRSAR
jgi:hypothetical protein